MAAKDSIYLCMGSACHQRGVYDVLPILRRLVSEYHLDTRVELKGSFCLGPCTNGIVAKYRDELFTDISTGSVVQIFTSKILPRILEANKE